MEQSPHWHPHSSGNYPHQLMFILRLVDRLLEQLLASDRTRDRVWRVMMGCGVFAYFWLLLMVLRILDTWLLILPEAVQSIVYLVPAPSPTITSFLYLLVPVSIIVTATMTFTARRKSTCPDCETPLALEWIGTYYQDSDRFTRTETDANGNKYTVTTVPANQVLRCTQEKCGAYVIREIMLTE